MRPSSTITRRSPPPSTRPRPPSTWPSQYKVGSISFLDLLTAETTLMDARQALAASDQALSNDQVAVFQALGGGWEDAPAVTAPKIPG